MKENKLNKLRCRTEHISYKHSILFPPFAECTYFCTSDYAPVCGSDGNTHSNMCEMGRAACEQDIEITLAYLGECGPGMK